MNFPLLLLVFFKSLLYNYYESFNFSEILISNIKYLIYELIFFVKITNLSCGYW